jgi:hypothetical protein
LQRTDENGEKLNCTLRSDSPCGPDSTGRGFWYLEY